MAEEDVMTNVDNTVSRRWRGASPAGITTASLLLVLLISTLVGAVVGLVLGGQMDPGLVAIAAGFLGTITAGFIRNTLLIKAWGAVGVEDVGTPITILIFAALASLAGSLAADRIALFVETMPAIVLGGLSGLLSAALLSLLIAAYRMSPAQPMGK